MAGPGNPFGWLNINAGYVSAAPTLVNGVCVSASATIQLATGSVTATQGSFVTTANGALPRFTTTALANSGSIVLSGTIGTTATQQVTIWNYPVMLGAEWSGTIASGGVLASSSSGWRGTGVITAADLTPAGGVVQATLADLYFFSGGTMTPAVGGVASVWTPMTFDGGTHFESALATPSTTVAPFPESPRGQISLDNAAFAAGSIKVAENVNLLSCNFSSLLWNTSGVVMPANSGLILAPKMLAQ